MKQRGKQSRPPGITEFVKPVRSAEEKALNHELHTLHTKKKRTYWLGFCTDLNHRVVTVWQQTKTLCNMYLESEEHLQLHNKEIVLQASQAEVIYTNFTICGLPAETSSYCRQPLQLQPPRNEQGTRRGRGRGAADSIRACARCRKNASEDGLMAGHDCLLYLISIGQDPRQYTAYCPGSLPTLMRYNKHGMALLPTMEQTQEQVAAKKKTSVKG